MDFLPLLLFQTPGAGRLAANSWIVGQYLATRTCFGPTISMFRIDRLIHESFMNHPGENLLRMNNRAVHCAARPAAPSLKSSLQMHSPHSRHICTWTVLPRRESRME